MASPVEVPDPRVPPADPQAIRACLTPTLAAEFDHKWATALDRVKQTQDLTDLHALLANTKNIRIYAEESLTIRELSHAAAAVAEEMVERVIARFPQY